MSQTSLSNRRGVFLPDFCSVRMVLAVVLIAELLAMLLELASAPSEYGFMSGFGLRTLFILWVAVASAGSLCALRGSFRHSNDVLAGFAAFALIQAITLLETWLVSDFLPSQGIEVMPDPPVDKFVFYLRNLGASVIVSAVLLRYFYIQSQWKRQVKAESEARLEALQSRMRPHFLFNSLNTIASLTRVDPKLAEELVQDLAELLRASFAGEDVRLVPLVRELDLTKYYLNIELHRLGDRLQVEWALNGVPEDALLPPLSLQPLIENAVYHGIEPDPRGGEVSISGCLRMGAIVLTVKNPLPDMDSGASRQGNRIAMDNLTARIKGSFDGNGQVLISAVDGIYQVRLVIPYISDRK
ncbi:MAG: histidine kinase [Pseudomonadota bacterium]